MDFDILSFPSLIPDVFANRRFGVRSSDRVDEIAGSPKRASPELFLHFRVLSEYFASSDALYRLHDVFGQDHGYRLNEKMHMILVGANFEKVQIVALGDLKAGLLDRFVNLFRDHHPTILGRANDVIDETANIVAFVEI